MTSQSPNKGTGAEKCETCGGNGWVYDGRDTQFRTSECFPKCEDCNGTGLEARAQVPGHSSGCALNHDEATLRQFAQMDRDARRYAWLKTRINWRERYKEAADLSWWQREWTHVDVRPLRSERPDSEHIDEYIDSQLTTHNQESVK